jgi:hypothetical protein
MSEQHLDDAEFDAAHTSQAIDCPCTGGVMTWRRFTTFQDWRADRRALVGLQKSLWHSLAVSANEAYLR